MTFCEFSTTLNIIMYIKYITIFLLLLLIILNANQKKKKHDTKIIKQVIKYIIILIVLYLILFLIFLITNSNFKKCFLNSNPIKIQLFEKLTNSYKSVVPVESTNSYVEKIEADTSYKIIGGNEIKIYNQNTYPLSNYEFTFSDSLEGYNFKKSGNEVATLATLISSLPQGEDSNPIKILEHLKYSDLDLSTRIDMYQALNFLANEYDFSYKEISSEEMIDGIRRGGIVLAQVKGTEEYATFSCTTGYILIYNYDSSENFSVVSVNDKKYSYICPEGTSGFGNIIKPNINETKYVYEQIIPEVQNYYLVWR